MMTIISPVVIDCLKQFSNLIASGDLLSHESEVSQHRWQDELGRLRVWSANIGAHQTGQSSLDYRLRDASHIKDQTIKLLESLQRTFKDIEEVMNEPAPDDDGFNSGDEDDTEIQQIYRGLVNTINCLFQMSMAIRRPSQHDRLLGTKRADAACFEPYDRQHVFHKYPHADSAIVDRLGAAISRRRAGLKYRERHHAKLSRDVNCVLHDQPDTVSTELSQTIATEFNEESRIKFEDIASNSGVSQTSYAQTLLEGHDAVTIPPPPKESANGNPFECPYCFFIVTVQNQHSWARHIFRDMMPYMCIFPECPTPSRLYDSRREWYHHLQTKHSVKSNPDTELDCPLCRAAIFSGTYEKHLGRHLEELALFAMPRSTADEEAHSNASKCSSEQTEELDFPPQIEDGGFLAYPRYVPHQSGEASDNLELDPLNLHFSVSCTGRQIKLSDTRRKFPCPYCAFTFNSRGDLKQHMEKKNPSKMHWCGHASCQYIIRKDKFREHLDKHHNMQLSNEDLEKRVIPRRQKFPPRCFLCLHDLQSWEGWFNHWIDHTVSKANSNYDRDNHDENDENDDASNNLSEDAAGALPSTGSPVTSFYPNEGLNPRNSPSDMRANTRYQPSSVKAASASSALDMTSAVSAFLRGPDPFEELKSTGEVRSKASWMAKLKQELERVSTIEPRRRNFWSKRTTNDQDEGRR